MKANEKIFEHNANFLRMFNLQNHETIFEEMEKCLQARVKDKEREITEMVERVIKRAKQLEQAEQDIVARGLVPEEGPERTLLMFSKDENFEKRLLAQIRKKYKQAMFFFASSTEADDKQ